MTARERFPNNPRVPLFAHRPVPTFSAMSASRSRAGWMRFVLAVRQNRGALAFVLVWLSANAIVLDRAFVASHVEAIAVALCLHKMHGGWPGLYQSFTEVVVFGLVVSMVATNVTRRYRPEETCRALAAESEDHVVVVGLSNLGRRAYDLVTEEGKTCAVVEDDPELVADLVRDERPVVIGCGRERATLVAAGVAKAKVVLLTADDLEEVAVACRHVRELNPSCELVIRCPDDDVGQVLAKAYRARVVSTSKIAAEVVSSHVAQIRAKKVVVLGENAVGHRVVEALVKARVAHVLAPCTTDPAALEALGVAKADLVVVCDDDLGQNLIRIDRIRDVAPRVKIVCRVFHDDAAEILERAPFSCTVLSSSRTAIQILAKSGVFRELDIHAPRPTPARPVFAVTG